VYFWFGLLKLLGLSPCRGIGARIVVTNTLVHSLFPSLNIFFASYEMAIGIAFLFPGLERLALYLLIPHMITTFMPLVLASRSIHGKRFLFPRLPVTTL
jgi:hypothetical protein